MPDGSKYYEELTRKFTTTDLTPDEIHEIGWDELRRIRSDSQRDWFLSLQWSMEK